MEIFAKSPFLPHHAQTAPLPSAVHEPVQESASDPHSWALRRVSSPPAKHGQDPKSVHKMITFIERVIFFNTKESSVHSTVITSTSFQKHNPGNWRGRGKKKNPTHTYAYTRTHTHTHNPQTSKMN